MIHKISLILFIAILASGCSGQADAGLPADSPPAAEPADIAQTATGRDILPKLVNADGVELQVGMSRADYEAFSGQPMPNGWIISSLDGQMGALSIEDTIIWLSPGNGWTLDNGIQSGMPVENVRAMIGTEDVIIPDDPDYLDSLHRVLYQFDDGGTVEFMYFKNDSAFYKADTVSFIRVYSDQYTQDIPSLLGMVYADERGDGDGVVEPIAVASNVVYRLTHTDAVSLFFIESDSGASHELYSNESEGRASVDPTFLITPYDQPINGKLRIETSGAWRIVAFLPRIVLQSEDDAWFGFD